MTESRWPLRSNLLLRMMVAWRGRQSTAVVCGDRLWRGSTTAPCVALTFDDGPDRRWTPAILQALSAARARATFFLIGSQILAEPELACEIAATHEVGTHLFSHRRGLPRSRAPFHTELRAALDAHQQVLQKLPVWLRFPFGDVGQMQGSDWQAYGLTACHWSLDSRDSRTADPDEILRQVIPRLRPGAIVLLHDGMGADSRLGPGHREATVAALPRLLAAIDERKLRTTTLSELSPEALGSCDFAMRRAA